MILGLTGSIATGKSTAAAYFCQRGIPVVDADKIARDIVAPETVGLQKIVETFGKMILQTDGSLNRAQLGSLIFADAEKRTQLDQLLAPLLRQAIQEAIIVAQRHASLVVVDIPLLFEAGYTDLVDKVAVVYVSANIQKQRLMARDNIDEMFALQKMASQWSIEYKKQHADVVFNNETTPAALFAQIDTWLKEQKIIDIK